MSCLFRDEGGFAEAQSLFGDLLVPDLELQSELVLGRAELRIQLAIVDSRPVLGMLT